MSKVKVTTLEDLYSTRSVTVPDLINNQDRILSYNNSIFESLRRSYAEAGLNLVDGSFEEGGELLVASDVMITASGDGYSWAGPEFPHNVAKGTDPTLSGSGYVPRTDVMLREQLASSEGAGLSLSMIATAYGLDFASGSLWTVGAVLNHGEWAYSDNKVWSPNGASSVCGASPDYVNFHEVGTSGIIDADAFGVVSNGAGDYGNELTRALSFADLDGAGNVHLPLASTRAVTESLVEGNSGISGVSKALSILLLEGAGNYGLNVNGAGLGGSSTDGIEIDNLNLWGGKDITLLRMHGTGLFNIHDLLAQNNSKGSVVRFTQCQDGRFGGFDFLQCGGSYPASPSDGAIVYYGPGCNNIYSGYGRFEAPRNTAIYVDGADTIIYNGGKIDGSFGGVALTSNPFVVSNNGSISFSDYHITGFKATPLRISGHGKMEFTGVVGNGLSEAVFEGVDLSYLFGLDYGFLPGVILRPSLHIDATVHMTSDNTQGNVISSLFKIKTPNPLAKPNAGNDGRVTISGAFDTGSGYYQGSITEWNSSGFVPPTTNDRYIGLYITNLATGALMGKIKAQSGGLVQFHLIGGSVPDGIVHVKFSADDFMHLSGSIKATDRISPSVQVMAKYGNVVVNSASYSDGKTTLQLSGTVTNDALIGLFIKLNSKYWFIEANSGSQIVVINDASLDFTAATSYAVTYGKITDKLSVTQID